MWRNPLLDRLGGYMDHIGAFKSSLRFARSIQKVMKGQESTIALNDKEQEAARSFLSTIVPGFSSLDWHLAYVRAGTEFAPQFIPESMYYAAIERTIN